MYPSGINTGLAALPLNGDPEAIKVFAAIQILQEYITKLSRVMAVFDTIIAPGQPVAVYLSGGKLHARLANATDNTKPAVGFCTKVAGIAGTVGEFQTSGINEYCTGLTIGAQYYLDTTSGAITTAKPVGAGKIVQPIGFAITTTSLFFNPNNNWTQL